MLIERILKFQIRSNMAKQINMNGRFY